MTASAAPVRATDPVPETWDALWRQVDRNDDPLGRAIFDHIRRRLDVRGASVLELGCGSGTLLAEAARAGARHVTGVDMSPEALQVAAGNLRGRPHELLLTDMFRLGPQVRADIVWSSGVVEHFSAGRLPELMRLHRRLARRHVVVVAPASPHWNDVRMRTRTALRRFGWQLPLSKARLADLGRSAGLLVRDVRRCMPEYGVAQSFGFLPAYYARRALGWAENRFGGLVIAWYDVPGAEEGKAQP